MGENELSFELLQGLKQLEANIMLLRSYHAKRGLDISARFTKNTEDMLKVEYASASLKALAVVKSKENV